MSGENTDPRVEPGIGRSLERVRKSRGLSLWQVEQATRIRSRYLHDLERENFDVLPAVYVLGSLKTYADFLGLDGAALSRQLKASLVEPAEPNVPEQLASLGGAPDGDDEYEAAPVPAVGFDQLFLGMGVILVSILAVMTIVAAVAQGDESPISQIDQPSTPEAPSEIALAGNVREEDGANEAGNEVGNGSPANEETREDQPEEEAPKGDEDGEKGEDEGGKEEANVSQSASLFGDAEFVPMSPSSSPTTDAAASASPAPASPAPASPAPASPAPTTAEPDDAPTSSAPEPAPEAAPPASTVPESTAPASAGASQRPPDIAPDIAPGAASPAPAPSGGASPRAGGGGEGTPTGGSNSDPMTTEAGRVADEALARAGIVR